MPIYLTAYMKLNAFKIQIIKMNSRRNRKSE